MTAEQILKEHYMEDELDHDRIRQDREHWWMVAGNPAKFPNADLDFIDRFTEAADEYLCA